MISHNSGLGTLGERLQLSAGTRLDLVCFRVNRVFDHNYSWQLSSRSTMSKANMKCAIPAKNEKTKLSSKIWPSSK